MNETAQTRKDSPEYRRGLEEEKLILEATEVLYELMGSEGVSKADLARKIDKTRGHVTQLLDGSRNMTLRTLADLCFVLDHRLRLEAEPLSHRASVPAHVDEKHLVLAEYRDRRREPRRAGATRSVSRTARRDEPAVLVA